MENIDVQSLDPETGERIAKAFLPTETTLKMRNFIPSQLMKMIAFNLSVVFIVMQSKKH